MFSSTWLRIVATAAAEVTRVLSVFHATPSSSPRGPWACLTNGTLPKLKIYIETSSFANASTGHCTNSATSPCVESSWKFMEVHGSSRIMTGGISPTWQYRNPAAPCTMAMRGCHCSEVSALKDYCEKFPGLFKAPHLQHPSGEGNLPESIIHDVGTRCHQVFFFDIFGRSLILLPGSVGMGQDGRHNALGTERDCGRQWRRVEMRRRTAHRSAGYLLEGL